jgi:serpin B
MLLGVKDRLQFIISPANATLICRTLSDSKTKFMRQNLRAGTLSACLILLFALTLPSCHKDISSPTGKALDLPPNSDEVISAGNDFAINFFQTVLQKDLTDNTNKLISPLSIYTALSMVYNGAAGATKDSMTKAMALAGIPAPRLNALNKALIEQMPHEDSKVQLSIANSIWYSQHAPQPKPAFLDTIRRDYAATMQSLDFGNPSAVKTINSWVAQHTNNKIPSIIDQIGSDDLMYLINAIYFNGSWKYSFKTADTHDGSFYKQDGTIANVPFMTREISLRKYVAPAFALLELPYGTGKAFDMYILLPTDRQQPLNNFALSLTPAVLTAAFSHLDSGSIRLNLPKWEYAYSIDDMKPNLAKLGMGIAFGGDADFSDMYSAPVAITKAIHKTYIKVNESGTEAAAVTAIGISLTSTSAPPPPFSIDHPFVYLITEKQTGSILFMGLLNDPLAK